VPEYNLIVRNFLGLHFSPTTLVRFGTNVIGPPPEEKMMIDASMHASHELGSFKFTYVIQATDLTGQYEVPLEGRAGAGLELTYKNYFGRSLFQLRAGWGRGYPSLGFGIIGKKIQLDGTWYTQDVGAFYHEYGDPRLLLQFRFRIGTPQELGDRK
jgi:hypothetical protein